MVARMALRFPLDDDNRLNFCVHWSSTWFSLSGLGFRSASLAGGFHRFKIRT